MITIRDLPKVRVVIVNENGGLSVTEIVDDIDVFQDIIDTDCVDMPRRFIGNTEYRIICDDTGLLKTRRPTCYHIPIERSILVGTVIFTAFTDDGEDLRPLTDEEVQTVIDHYDEEQMAIQDLSFRPTKLFGIDLWKWDRAYHTDHHAADNVHLLCTVGEITKEDAETALDRILEVD